MEWNMESINRNHRRAKLFCFCHRVGVSFFFFRGGACGVLVCMYVCMVIMVIMVLKRKEKERGKKKKGGEQKERGNRIKSNVFPNFWFVPVNRKWSVLGIIDRESKEWEKRPTWYSVLFPLYCTYISPPFLNPAVDLLPMILWQSNLSRYWSLFLFGYFLTGNNYTCRVVE